VIVMIKIKSVLIWCLGEYSQVTEINVVVKNKCQFCVGTLTIVLGYFFGHTYSFLSFSTICPFKKFNIRPVHNCGSTYNGLSGIKSFGEHLKNLANSFKCPVLYLAIKLGLSMWPT
jgi:hypothetical protein